MSVRPERESDVAAIREILILAFSGTAEADLVERLRRDGNLLLSLVAEDHGIQGHAGFVRLRVKSGRGICEAAGLAPVAVLPELQRRGIGGALIREGHRRLAEQGIQLVFVLGDPSYYTRFGYSLAAAKPFKSVYSGAHFMTLRLDANAPQDGEVFYPAAFSRQG